MTTSAILAALRRRGPMTTAQLSAWINDTPAYVARDCARLVERGMVKRIDTQAPGRGRKATYALTEASG